MTRVTSHKVRQAILLTSATLDPEFPPDELALFDQNGNPVLVGSGNMVFKGDWVEAVYDPGSVVVHNGSTYISMGRVGTDEPDAPPVETVTFNAGLGPVQASRLNLPADLSGTFSLADDPQSVFVNFPNHVYYFDVLESFTGRFVPTGMRLFTRFKSPDNVDHDGAEGTGYPTVDFTVGRWYVAVLPGGDEGVNSPYSFTFEGATSTNVGTSTGEWVKISSLPLPGPKGDKGDKGDQGDPGADGADGSSVGAMVFKGVYAADSFYPVNSVVTHDDATWIREIADGSDEPGDATSVTIDLGRGPTAAAPLLLPENLSIDFDSATDPTPVYAATPAKVFYFDVVEEFDGTFTWLTGPVGLYSYFHSPEGTNIPSTTPYTSFHFTVGRWYVAVMPANSDGNDAAFTYEFTGATSDNVAAAPGTWTKIS